MQVAPTLIIGGREVARTYRDPSELIWVEVARRLGLSVRRAGDVYASYDGVGGLVFGDAAALDADDCLAQLIYHELIHWITNGEETYAQVDWGFEPMEHVEWREFPAVRLQGWLARQHGLEQVLGPTTNMRPYYDALSDFLAPADDSELERKIVEHTLLCVERIQAGPGGRRSTRAWRRPRPFTGPSAALCARERLGTCGRPALFRLRAPPR